VTLTEKDGAAMQQLSIDSLIQDELVGKAQAIGRYDDFLWKIRFGYASILYSSIALICGLIEKNIFDLSAKTGMAMVLLIAGFSVAGFLIDKGFMESKLRVIDYRDRLLVVALAYVEQGRTVAADTQELVECLKNSGERNQPIDWSKHVGQGVIRWLYGTTGCLCCLVVILLTQ